MPPAEPTGLDPAVLASLYLQHGDELRRFVFGVVRDAEAARDIAQTVFTKAVEHGDELRPGDVKGWLFTVAYHESLQWRRRNHVDRKAMTSLAWLGVGQGAAEEAAVRGETVERVRRALLQLPEEQRNVVQARIYENRTFAQIAAATATPLGTVLTRMRTALRKLRQALAPGESQ